MPCWQAQDILHACELFQSPAGAALVASMGHLQREQGNMEGRVCNSHTNLSRGHGALCGGKTDSSILACLQQSNAAKTSLLHAFATPLVSSAERLS